MRLSLRPSAELVAWAAERIDALTAYGSLDNATALGVEDGAGNIAGVVVFSDYRPDVGTMQVSAAADDARWLLSRKAVARMREYVFIDCKCQKIWSITPRKNKRALRLVKAFGLKPEAILERQFGEDDAVISRQFREEIYGHREEPAHADAA